MALILLMWNINKRKKITRHIYKPTSEEIHPSPHWEIDCKPLIKQNVKLIFCQIKERARELHYVLFNPETSNIHYFHLKPTPCNTWRKSASENVHHLLSIVWLMRERELIPTSTCFRLWECFAVLLSLCSCIFIIFIFIQMISYDSTPVKTLPYIKA